MCDSFISTMSTHSFIIELLDVMLLSTTYKRACCQKWTHSKGQINADYMKIRINNVPISFACQRITSIRTMRNNAPKWAHIKGQINVDYMKTRINNMPISFARQRITSVCSTRDNGRLGTRATDKEVKILEYQKRSKQ